MQHSRRRFGCLFVAGDFSLENLEIVVHGRILVLECSLTPEIPALKGGFFFPRYFFFFVEIPPWEVTYNMWGRP